MWSNLDELNERKKCRLGKPYRTVLMDLKNSCKMPNYLWDQGVVGSNPAAPATIGSWKLEKASMNVIWGFIYTRIFQLTTFNLKEHAGVAQW